MVNEAIGPEHVEREFVGVWSALAIPFFADDGGVAIGVEGESLSGGGEHVAKYLSSNLRWNAQQRRVIVQSSYCFRDGSLFCN